MSSILELEASRSITLHRHDSSVLESAKILTCGTSTVEQRRHIGRWLVIQSLIVAILII